MTTSAATASLPPWFPLAFVGIWLLVCTILGWMAGHMALLARYSPFDEPKQESFFFASGYMRWGVHFGGALYVGIGERGLHLAPNWLFRSPFWRRIPCIPWKEVSCVRRQTGGLLGWFSQSKFELPSWGFGFRVAGAPGRAIERKLGVAARGAPGPV